MRQKLLKCTAFLIVLIFLNSILSSLFSLDKLVNGIVIDDSESTMNPVSSNFDSIQDILDTKNNDYNSLGYFPQIYQPSLQATYYALYILDKIGRLSEINITEASNFIMSYYDMSSNLFSDDYSKRYLDINLSKTYYPYTSLLEVNCYAILALKILNKLDLVNSQNFINFIWSCYNPVTSGFIGQPYNYILPNFFKLSTMDNTFYAISTLDLLMGSWNGYQIEKTELVQYINSLQSTNTFFWYFGGFYNDEDHSLDTLDLFEPNLISSYYCIKSLDIFDLIDTISINNFHQYLDGLYDSQTYSFQMAHFLPIANFGNLVATSLGLALSDLTEYTNIDKQNVEQFILNNRNTKGVWNYSTNYVYCELIDTFQVIRALADSETISQLTELDKGKIEDALNLFKTYRGYSLLSEDYSSLDLLYTTVNSFDLYNRISELDSEYIFSQIENSCVYLSPSDCEGFMAGVIFEDNCRKYRSFPIEYYCSGTQQHLQRVESALLTHKTAFIALNSLEKLGKLEDFALTHDLNDLLQSILECQFLENGYANYGAFLPFLSFSLGSPAYQNEKIFIDYSYYAIKSLEILSNYLSLGNVSDLLFDKIALSNYIINHMLEDETFLYFLPEYTTLPEILLENTFYAIYILKAIGMYNLNEVKIRNFVLANVNYSNIKSVYYSYKISKIIDTLISLDFDSIYNLIGDIYSDIEKEYYFTSQRKKILQEILLWICEMVVNDLYDSHISISIISLEDCQFLSTGNNLTYSINSTYGGTMWLWIDEILVDIKSFSPEYDVFIYSLDNYTNFIDTYSVQIEALAINDDFDSIISNFTIYSNSITTITILSLDNYEFLTTGNFIAFRLSSGYPDCYNFTIDDIEISSGTFYNKQDFIFSIDGYSVGDHIVFIGARGLDGNESYEYATFTVYSLSEAIISVYSANNYIFNSTGNILNFSISSSYPEVYKIEIDSSLVDEGFYVSNEPIIFSIDGYGIGLHTIYIWANSSDYKETSTNIQFTVFSESFIDIQVIHLNNYEFKTTENYLRFFLNASFPDSFRVSIDSEVKCSGIYQYGGEYFNVSIDNYFVGEYNITIWANSSDGKEASCSSSFTVYSLSNTIVTISELPDYEYNTTGHYVKFNISSLYPDYYNIYINDQEVFNGSYESKAYFNFSIDGYGIGFHSILIWAIGEDGKVGQASGEFNVYSNSTTIIVVNSIPNYKFQSIGNYLNFSINSDFNGVFNISIDNVLIMNGSYSINEIILCVIDGYFVGIHNVSIKVKSLDGKNAGYYTNFSVYSNSSTIIHINNLSHYEFLSSGNLLNFTIYSDYPNYYELWIDGFRKQRDNFTNGVPILYSLDNYTSSLGNHCVYIWAIAKDLKVGILYAQFSILSSSNITIEILHLEDFIINSTGNYLEFIIFTKYPFYYKIWIDDMLIAFKPYLNGTIIRYSLDNYTSILGFHKINITATSLDLKELTLEIEFNVYMPTNSTEDPEEESDNGNDDGDNDGDNDNEDDSDDDEGDNDGSNDDGDDHGNTGNENLTTSPPILIGSILMSIIMISLPTIMIILSKVYHSKINKRFSNNFDNH